METAERYRTFLANKSQIGGEFGFRPLWMPKFLFDFQSHLVEWATRKGRAAIFADCGMGKTPMQLVWAENVRRHTDKPVLILTPLAVSYQTVREGERFGIECHRSDDGTVKPGITVTNYERLQHFNPSDFAGVVCDESSILKNFDGRTKVAVTEFMRTLPYRLLCTATAAPNDYHELGTSSEALGYMGYQDMLSKFFKEDIAKDLLGWGRKTYRFRGHAEEPFWRWVCSWARACRKPSDLGYDDRSMVLPELTEDEIVVQAQHVRPGMLFSLPARTLQEQRDERRETIEERCHAAAEIARKAGSDPVVIWCHLNDEADHLERIISDAQQVSGSQDDDEKERRLLAFQQGKLRVLITKPKIGCFGLNWQHCADVVTFASHSWEQYYQAVRRCWRFGQTRHVAVSVIATEGEIGVLSNLRRKADGADRMFERLVHHMQDALAIDHARTFAHQERVPRWLSMTR